MFSKPQARDEASLRPSLARKLNEKIRALEGELELLRTNKKVKDLEKKVQVRSNTTRAACSLLSSNLLDVCRDQQGQQHGQQQEQEQEQEYTQAWAYRRRVGGVSVAHEWHSIVKLVLQQVQQ
jgi:hypothetical protein